MRRSAERVGFVKGPVIEEQQREAGGSSSGKGLQEEVKAWGMEDGQFPEEARAGERFHGPIPIQTLSAISRRPDRLAPTSRDPMPQDGQQPTAALVLRPHATALGAVWAGSLDGG
jgi:hypothetical protein